MANPSKNSPVAEQLKDLMTSDTSPVAPKCAKVALGSSDSAGGIMSWQNPESSAIVVVRIVIDRTTKSTGACTADFGTAANGTISSDNLMDGVDVGATLPSIEAIPVDERLAAYDQVIAAIRGNPNFPQEALQGLEEQEQAIKAKLREPEGDVRGALEVAAKPLTAPAIELFVDDAYDMAFERLSNDPDFPQNALDGLDAQSDLVKQHIGGGRIKDALKVGARGLAGPLIDETLDDLREELAPGDLLDFPHA